MRYLGLLFFVTALCTLATPCRAQTGTDWKLNDDRQHVTVTFLFSNPTPVTLDVKGVEDLLENLGRYRMNMSPEIPRSLAAGTEVFPVVDPIWRIQEDPKTRAIVISIRDPRYGWLNYAIARETASRLIYVLQYQINHSPLVPGP
jgi:hypothetical protein